MRSTGELEGWGVPGAYCKNHFKENSQNVPDPTWGDPKWPYTSAHHEIGWLWGDKGWIVIRCSPTILSFLGIRDQPLLTCLERSLEFRSLSLEAGCTVSLLLRTRLWMLCLGCVVCSKVGGENISVSFVWWFVIASPIEKFSLLTFGFEWLSGFPVWRMFFDNLVVNKMASGCLMLRISSRGSEAVNKHPTTVWIVNCTLVESILRERIC